MSSLCAYRIAAGVPQVKPGNITENTREIIQCCQEAAEKGVSLLLFPELSLTGAYCGDLFGSSRFKKEVSEALKELQDFSAACELGFIAGFPLYARGTLFNCAAFFHKGRIDGISCKYAVDGSLFASGTLLEGETLTINGQDIFCSARQIYESDELRFAVIIGDDILLPGNPAPPLAARGAQFILNPAAPPELAAVSQERSDALEVLSRTLTAAVVTSGAGPGEPGSDFICGGRAAIFNNGRCDAENTPLPRERDLIFADIIPERLDQRRIRKNISNPFIREELFFFTPVEQLPPSPDWAALRLGRNPFIPEDAAVLETRCREIIRIQSTALARRVSCTRSKKLVIGLSGGLDSTWAFLVCVECCKLLGLPPETICAVTMPGFGTSSRTKGNAEKMAELFGAELRIISIADAVTAHFKDIGHDPEKHNIAYENSQARERTQILMDLANELSGMVIGTGDLSELALGWCTYNGDQMSMYGVNGSIPKTLMRYLVTFYAENIATPEECALLKDVVATPVSPELLPGAQHTEELVGSYDLHDFFLWHTVQYGADGEFLQAAAEKVFAGEFTSEEIASALKIFTGRFRTQQFKRNPMPDGAKAGTLSLSPRTDWKAPSDC